MSEAWLEPRAGQPRLDLVIRPISRGHGRSVLGSALTAEQREQLVAQICARAAPLRRPGGAAPVVRAHQRARQPGPPQRGAALVRGPQRRLVHRHAGRAGPGHRRHRRTGGARWSPRPTAGWPRTSGWSAASPSSPPGSRCAARPDRRARLPGHREPAVVADGAPRAQRPVLVRPLRRAGRGPAPADPGHPHRGHRDRLRRSPRAVRWRCCCRRSPTSAPPTPASSPRATCGMMPELRSMLLDRHRAGTAAQSIGALSTGRPGRPRPAVRGRLDGARRHRPGAAALAANPYDQGLQLTDASERVLSGSARPVRHRQREHGPRPGLVHARLRPRAGAGHSRCWRCSG